MLCRDPYIHSSGQAFPCGRCLPCLLKRKRTWTHRIMLESLCHGDNAFVTLTYEDAKLPVTSRGLPTLVPEHVRDFLKRLRKAVSPLRLRYFLVGEYGDATERPHYHLALFGYPTCLYGRSRYDRFHADCCVHCDRLSSVWGYGHVLLGELSTHSAQYVAGYVTKKLNRTDDRRLNGRWPEFSRMSLRPGLGVNALPEIADVVLRLNLVDGNGDVPSALRHGSRIMPLGRYLRRKLREQIGKAPAAPLATVCAAQEAVSHLRAIAFANEKLPGEVKRAYFKELILNEFGGAASSAENRARIFKQGKSL